MRKITAERISLNEIKLAHKDLKISETETTQGNVNKANILFGVYSKILKRSI